jgi:Tol biopolymer transport system component
MEIVFASDRSGLPQIYSMNADGSGLVRLTTDSATDDAPNWSPDGGTIAFDTNSAGFTDVWTMDPSGNHQQKLVAGTQRREGPTWSPDGSRIASASDQGLVSTDLAGGTPGTITTNAADGKPAWSPDGQKIAFVRSRNIWLVNADGGSPQALTAMDDDNPTWSPDAGFIAFSRAVAGAGEHLYIMNANGSGVRNLTGTDAGFIDQIPNWSRH